MTLSAVALTDTLVCPAGTGTLDGTGAFSNSIPINPLQPASFFRLRTP